MYDVHLADISGSKRQYLKARIDELETNSKIKGIRDLYRDIIDFRRVTSLELI